ncbi:MAG: pectin esterase [Lachnospiraceae bacterium]|nr:pectin esterase [Lachnospiraceae bacterium]
MKSYSVGADKDYHTVNEALQAVRFSEESVITVDEGSYREKLFFEKEDLTITGQGPEKTLIINGDGAKDILSDGSRRGTFRSYTVFLSGKRITLKDLSIINDAGPGRTVGQSVSVYSDAETVYMENVFIDSHQDTLFMAPLPAGVRQPGGFFGPRHLGERTLTRQYYKNCRISGDIDFIFGGADALFEDCEIIVKNRGEEINGYIAAPCESDGEFGIVFKDCMISAEEGTEAGSVFLGRPWRPKARTVYLNCSFDESINNRRFSGWGSDPIDPDKTRFAEYGSKDKEGRALDLSLRDAGVRILDEREANILLQKLEGLKEDIKCR